MCEGPVGRVGVSARAHPRHGTRTRMPARLVRGYAFGTCFALYSLVTWCLWRAQALVSPVVRRMIQWERSKMSVQAATAAPAQECLTLRLEEVDSAVVTAFVDFVYQGCVTIAHDIELLLALGMLADRLDVGSLRRAVLEGSTAFGRGHLRHDPTVQPLLWTSRARAQVHRIRAQELRRRVRAPVVLVS
jgi:hypothetical protein